MDTTETMVPSSTETDPTVIENLREVSKHHARLYSSRLELARLVQPELELSAPVLKEGFYAAGYDEFYWNNFGKHPGAVSFKGAYTSVEHGDFSIRGRLYAAPPFPTKEKSYGASLLTVFNLAPEKFCDHKLAAAYAADTSTVGYTISYFYKGLLVATSVGVKTHGLLPAMGGDVRVTC